MKANKNKNTGPELSVRKLLHAEGYRYRLHSKDLAGKPDIVFRTRKRVIEVYGCFWHGHGCHPLGQLPKSRTEYWTPKIAGNQERDKRNVRKLKAEGWEVLVLWECDVRRGRGLKKRLIRFLGLPKK